MAAQSAPSPTPSGTPATTLSNGATQATQSTLVEAESSKSASNDFDGPAFASNLQSYIFNTGFCHQQFADVQVVFFQASLKLHRLILARSPYLAHLIMSLPPGSTMQLAFTDENITQEAVYIALQHLYNPANHLVNAANARAVLATASLLGSMPELVHLAYQICSETLSAANVHEFVQWLHPQPRIDSFAVGEGGWKEPSVYGEYSERLRADVLDFLLHALPAQLGVEPQGSLHSDPRLLAAYVPLPFELFKHCVESPELAIPFMQDRFAFAKRAIAQRKKRSAGQGGPQMEESVVLALRDDGDGMGVQITRKPKRSRQLWKVEG